MVDRTERGKRQSRYWAWSAGIHAAALLLLIFCTPVREIVFERERKAKPEITMSGEKLKEVIEKIRDSEEEALRERVALLGLGVDRIRINLLNKQRNNQGFEDAQKAAAYDRVLEAMRRAVAAQDAKLPLHERNVGKTYNPDDQMEIQRQDVIARGQQDDIEAALPLLPAVDGLEQLIADQKAASDQQSLAANFTRWTHGAAHNQLSAQREIERWTTESTEAETRLGEAATDLTEAEAAHKAAAAAFVASEEAFARAEQAAKTADQGVKQAEADAKEAAKQALDQARKDRDQARKDRDQARKDRDQAKKAAGNAQRDRDRAAKTLEDRLAKLQQAKASLAKADAEREKKDGELTWHATRARDLQQDILERYQALFTSASVAEQLAAERAAKPVVLGPDGKPPLVTAPDVPSTTHDELLAAGLADLFDISDRQIAQAVTDYRAIKAIDLARMRDLAIATALDQIAPLDPLPTAVDTDLLRKDITDPELVEPHKQEVLKVKASVEEKIALVEQLLKELESFEMEMAHAEMQMEEQTLEDMVAEEVFDETAEQEDLAQDLMEQLSYEEKRELQNEHMEALAQLAQEDEQQRMKDLTQLMKQSPLQPPPPPQSGEESAENPEAAKPPPPPPMTASGKSTQDGAAPQLDLRPDTPGVLARKIADDGVPKEWMYVDTWYTIGPFANEGRRNLNTRFPPETVVDLEAKYVGKGGKQIKWSFVQGRGPMIEPADAEEYAIYYAYTEIHSDRPRDIWVAVGSDDKANIWINDMPVWISGDKLKGWNIQEGYRKVHLNEGINKVLYRVENGWRGVAFSMAIHTKAGS